MKCPEPLDAAVLADYWLGLLNESEAAPLELHLFGCDDCGARLRELIALAGGIRKLVQQGALRLVVSDSFVQAAADDGLRVREYAMAAGGRVNCTVTESDDMLIARLAADLSGTGRIDLRFYDHNGAEQGRMTDIPVNGADREVVCLESMQWAKQAPDNVLIARLVAVGDGDEERLVGEYAFHHTRSIPGPPGW